MTKEELRQALTSDMEAVIAEVLDAADGRDLDLTVIEDLALDARHEFGRRVAQRLLNEQVDRQGHELPQGVGGKPLHPKGKKTKSSSRARGK